MSSGGAPDYAAQDRIPMKRLLVGFLVLVVGTVALVLMLAEPPEAEPVAVAETQPAATDERTSEPPSTMREVSPEPSETGRRRDQVPPEEPTREPEPVRTPTRTPQPATPLIHGTVGDLAVAIYSPWAMDDEARLAPALPAPPDERYVVLTVDLWAESAGTLAVPVASGPDETAVVVLRSGEAVIEPLGRLSERPNLQTPFDIRSLRLGAGMGTVTARLAFLVPADVETVEVRVDDRSIKELSLSAAATSVDPMAGTWERLPYGQHSIRHLDPVVETVCGSDHQLLAVTPGEGGRWRFDLPLTGLTASSGEAIEGRASVRFSLSGPGSERDVVARLAGDGEVLVLYLGDDPGEWVVYRRRDGGEADAGSEQ